MTPSDDPEYRLAARAPELTADRLRHAAHMRQYWYERWVKAEAEVARLRTANCGRARAMSDADLDEYVKFAAEMAAPYRTGRPNTTSYAELCAEGVRALVAEVRRLRLEIAGHEKAAALMLAGMESVTQVTDRLKHEIRELREGKA